MFSCWHEELQVGYPGGIYRYAIFSSFVRPKSPKPCKIWRAVSCGFKAAMTLNSLQQKLKIHKFATSVANKEKTMRDFARGAEFFFVFSN